MELVKYNISVQVYNTPQIVSRVDQCNGWTATNTGDTAAVIEGVLLLPGVPGTSKGDSVSVGGNLGEVYTGGLRLTFDVITPGIAPAVEIIQKFYVDEF